MATEEKQAPPIDPNKIDLNNTELIAPDDGVFDAYANVVNMNWTLNDVRLRFAELIQVPNEESPTWKNQHGVVLEKVAVTLPWHQAKLLRDLLDGVIKNYERINGELKPIRLPDPPSDPVL